MNLNARQGSLHYSKAGLHRLSRHMPGKRLLDLSLAIPALLLALPVLLLAACAIALTSRGPVIFSQPRIGIGGKTFRCHKLRTMFSGSPTVPTHEAQASCITPLGHILRRTKMDELPQLWNVIRGDMSLVGPRPCLTEQAELLFYRQAFGASAAKPGITGLAQVQGIDMSRPILCAQADADYLDNWSLRRDLALLWRTVMRKS